MKAHDQTLLNKLFEHAKVGDHSVIKLFNKVGANLDLRNWKGESIAHVAASHDQYDLLLYLAKSVRSAIFESGRNAELENAVDMIRDPNVQQRVRQMIVSKHEGDDK